MFDGCDRTHQGASAARHPPTPHRPSIPSVHPTHKEPPDMSRRRNNHHDDKRQKRSDDAAREWELEQQLTASLFGGGAAATTQPLVSTKSRSTHPQTDASSLLWTDKNNNNKEEKEEPTTNDFAFEIDVVGDAAAALDHNDDHNDDDHTSDHTSDDDDDGTNPTATHAAWIDQDDVQLHTNLQHPHGHHRMRKLRTHQEEDVGAVRGDDLHERLRDRFVRTTQATARTDWATIVDPPTNRTRTVDRDDDDDDTDHEDTALTSSSAPLLVSSSSSFSTSGGGAERRLAPNLLDCARCPDANLHDPSRAAIQAVHFHPGITNPSSNANTDDTTLLLTAGLDKTLRFFSVTETGSTKIHSLFFPKLPIYSAAFLGTSGTVVVTGRRPFFYLYDSVAGHLDTIPRVLGRSEKSWERCVASPDGRTLALYGNDGYVVVMDRHSKACTQTFKINGSVRAVSFRNDDDGSELVASGSDGDVYRFDVRSKRCLERFSNQDGSITSALAMSSRTIAVGAESGVVNLYPSQRPSSQTTRTASKSILNLKTSADTVRFNADGNILAVSSKREQRGLRLVHVPTGSVFSNWPTSKTPLNYVWSLDFSPSSKFLAVGNDKGKCLLYKLGHYDNDDP